MPLKAKSTVARPTSVSSTSTRSTSRSGSAVPEPLPTPQSPEDSTLPVKMPLNAREAKRLLFAHSHLDSETDLSTAGTCSAILAGIANRPDTPQLICALVKCVELILPEAFQLVCTTNDQLKNISEKIDTLLSNSEKLPATASPALAELGEKLDKVSQDVQQATETWKTVPARSRPREPSSPGVSGPTPNPTPRQQPPPPPQGPTRADITRDRRQKSQGCHILVEPTSQSLEGMNARALAKKAEFAWDAAWDAVKNTAIAKDLGLTTKPRVTFKSAIRLARGGIRYELGDRTQAALLSDARIAAEFEKGFGGASCKGQGATILLQCAPVEFQPENPAAIPSFERENQLSAGDVLSMTWCKPPHKRKADQVMAVIKLEMRSHDLADRLITEGGQLNYLPVRFSKARQEPTRCLRCQNYGHKADKCKTGNEDICSRCGETHRIANCPNPDKKRCVPCKSDTHCSFDRACPTFRAECDKFNQRRPENRNLLYGSSRPYNPAQRQIHFPPPTAAEMFPGGGYTSLFSGQNEAIRAMQMQPAWGGRTAWGGRPTVRKETGQGEIWDTPDLVTAPRRTTPASGANTVPLRTQTVATGANTEPVRQPSPPVVVRLSPAPQAMPPPGSFTPSAPFPVTPEHTTSYTDFPHTPARAGLPFSPHGYAFSTPGSDFRANLVTPTRTRSATLSSIDSTATVTQ